MQQQYFMAEEFSLLPTNVGVTANDLFLPYFQWYVSKQIVKKYDLLSIVLFSILEVNFISRETICNSFYKNT